MSDAAESPTDLDAAWSEPGVAGRSTLRLRFENGGWTADSTIESEQCSFVVRFGESFDVRQFLLFRDMDEPDLWLATDGQGNWGEMNGAHRPELRGCRDVELDHSPVWLLGPVRRANVAVNGAFDVLVARVDVETLDVTPRLRRFTRLADRRWRIEDHLDPDAGAEEIVVDEHGLVVSHVDRFHRAV